MKSFANRMKRGGFPLLFIRSKKLPAVCGFWLLAVGVISAEPIFIADFESVEAGEPYASEDWMNAGFAKVAWSQGFDQGRVIVDATEAAVGQKSIRVTYPKGGVGPAETGAQAPLMLPPRQEYFLSYWLRVGENFSWGSRHEGGKLPGLAAGDLCSGGQHCDGSNGFSARLMWRTGGQAVLYLYHMDKPGKYGEDFELVYPNGESVVFEPGKWFQIVERVRINSGNENDGLVQIWINEEEVLLKENLRFVNNGDLVDTFFFSTFHGGGDSEWAPQQDSFIWFDRFAVGDSFSSVK